MAMTKREKMIAIGTGAAFALFAGDRYALSPYIAAREAVAKDQTTVTQLNDDAERTFTRQKRLDKEWRGMVSGGLKSDPGDAEQQLFAAVRDWAREAGMTVLTSEPQRIAQRDRTQIVRLLVSGTGSSSSFANLLYKLETSAIPV